MTEYERFGLVFTKTRVYKFGHCTQSVSKKSALHHELSKARRNSCAGICKKKSVWVRNRVGIGLSYQPARLHSLAELVPWNRFWGSIKV
jgi:hypothetical protein